MILLRYPLILNSAALQKEVARESNAGCRKASFSSTKRVNKQIYWEACRKEIVGPGIGAGKVKCSSIQPPMPPLSLVGLWRLVLTSVSKLFHTTSSFRLPGAGVGADLLEFAFSGPTKAFSLL